MIIANGKSPHSDLNIDTEYKVNDGLLRSFKNLYGIRQLSISSERKSASTEAALKYRTEFKAILEEKKIHC